MGEQDDSNQSWPSCSPTFMGVKKTLVAFSWLNVLCSRKYRRTISSNPLRGGNFLLFAEKHPEEMGKHCFYVMSVPWTWGWQTSASGPQLAHYHLFCQWGLVGRQPWQLEDETVAAFATWWQSWVLVTFFGPRYSQHVYYLVLYGKVHAAPEGPSLYSGFPFRRLFTWVCPWQSLTWLVFTRISFTRHLGPSSTWSGAAKTEGLSVTFYLVLMNVNLNTYMWWLATLSGACKSAGPASPAEVLSSLAVSGHAAVFQRSVFYCET